MNEILTSLRDLVQGEDIGVIDNTIFRLHYKGCLAFLLFSFILTSQQNFGNPIYCLGEKEEVSLEAINSYCWVHSTFTLYRPFARFRVGVDTAHPGVAQVHDGDELTQHQYYQWICYVLFVQALMFYAPRYLWIVWEGGRVRNLSLELEAPILGEKWDATRKQGLIEYILMNLGQHNIYLSRYIFCEVLNFFNIILQFVLLNLLLNGHFTLYGLKVLMSNNSPFNFVDEVFPKVTKCTFWTFGPSGSLQNRELACVLPLNVFHEKAFVAIWWWLWFLGAMSFFGLCYRMATLMSLQLRLRTMHARAPRMSLEAVGSAARMLSPADWFTLEQLARNVNPIVIRDIYAELAIQPSSLYKLIV